jgi:hypothetical protein
MCKRPDSPIKFCKMFQPLLSNLTYYYSLSTLKMLSWAEPKRKRKRGSLVSVAFIGNMAKSIVI